MTEKNAQRKVGYVVAGDVAMAVHNPSHYLVCLYLFGVNFLWNKDFQRFIDNLSEFDVLCIKLKN